MTVLSGIIFGVFSAAFLAGTTLSVRLAMRQGRLEHVLSIVLLINLVVLGGLTVFFVREPVLTWTSLLAFVAAGIISTLIARAFFFLSIDRIGASLAESVKASMPLHATILAVLVLGEQTTNIQWVGIVLIVVGVGLVSREGATGTNFSFLGFLFALLAALLYGLEPILANVGFQQGTGVILGLTIKTTTATVCVFTYLAWKNSLPFPSELPTGQVRWFLLAGVLNTSFLLTYYAGLNVSRVGIVVPVMQTSPLIVAAISILFLNSLERVTPRLFVAASVVIVGSIIITLTG